MANFCQSTLPRRHESLHSPMSCHINNFSYFSNIQNKTSPWFNLSCLVKSPLPIVVNLQRFKLISCKLNSGGKRCVPPPRPPHMATDESITLGINKFFAKRYHHEPCLLPVLQSRSRFCLKVHKIFDKKDTTKVT